MHSLPSLFRVLVTTLVFALAAPALAQDATTPAKPEMEWQTVITSQIEAFRHKDAPAAFSYAAAGFQKSFPSPEVFFMAIIGSGYEPIMTSTSQSYAEFQLEPSGKDVVQIVRFVGPHQELFDAVYSLTREDSGWKVQGVMLGQQQGIGV